MNRNWGYLLIVGTLAAMATPTKSQAQEQNQVLVVPLSQRNPTLPHPAHEGARITLKAMVRNATCNGGYQVWWDTNFDGNYDNDYRRDVFREVATNSVWDIGRTFIVPTVDRDTRLNINVRVRNLCTSEDKFATMRLFVYDFTPSADPINWTDEQLEIMTSMGVQEALWYLHRTMSDKSSSNHQLQGADPFNPASGLTLWVNTINGHLPAYPPGSVTAGNGFVNLPDGWVEANRRRWEADPYAETAMRLANFLAKQAETTGIIAAEEDDTCGYNADRTVRRCNRLPNTTDSRGAVVTWNDNSDRVRSSRSVYRIGLNLGGLATVLPALAGTPLVLGAQSVQGQPWEWYIQQVTDELGYMQYDGGCAKGGWLYGPANGDGGCGNSDGSSTQWAYIGLESAEIAGGPYGVFVNNRHKYRIADNLIKNQRNDGGSGYRSNSGSGDLKLTGGALVASRWLGIHNMPNNNTVPFPNESGYTHAELKAAYNRYIQYVADSWTQDNSVGGHWGDDIWDNGDYLCGNRNDVYNAGRCGNTYTLYSLQKGFRTGQPEITRVGNHDWAREFQTYYLRAQDRHADPNNPTAGYSNTGRIYDDYCANHSVTCSYGGGRLSAPMGGLVLTPTIFNPKPIAIATVQPPRVTEGCAGGQNGRVVFDHSESFHPNADSFIATYQWDVDSSDGLWWEDANPEEPGDFVTPQRDGEEPRATFEYTYPRAGNYTATLRVIDEIGQSKTTTVTVRVDAAANVPPAAAHGGPYAIEVGSPLLLNGSGTDGNIGCYGQNHITIAWDLDNDGQFDDANSGNATVLWNAIQGLPRNQPNRVRIRVRDQFGLTATAETTLTIYPREPVADGRANPNPSACRVQVTFDGNASFHPNPQRTIREWDWNVDGNPGFEGSGAIFRYAYDQFGTYDVVLRVTDDLGRTATDTFQVEVNQGNLPPRAQIARAEVTVLEGDPLTLDGRGSLDPNANCGDSIVNYEWDINADGDFNDPVDLSGPAVRNPTIQWDTLVGAAGLAITDRDTGVPVHTMRLRVTDEFGATHVTEVRVRLLLARPEAVVVQNPDPASVNRRNGIVSTTLDGRESRSPVPGVNIVRYDWDLDDDGTIDTQNRPFVDFQRVVPPAQRVNELLPEYCVRLQVTDSTGRQSQLVRYCINMRVPPTPPTADADPTDPPERAYHILLGEGVRLDASQSADPDDDDFIRFYRWDLTYRQADGFRADITREDADGNGAEAVVDVTAQQLAGFGIAAVGTFPVLLEVEDDSALTVQQRQVLGLRGETNTDPTTITVHPRDPSAVALVNPNPASCGALVTFDGSRSAHPHPQIEIVGHAWDFDGDGAFDDAQGEITTNRYQRFTFDGETITVGLQVLDSRGNSATQTVQLAVTDGNRAPIANAGGFRNAQGQVVGPYAIAVGDDLQLSSAGSSDPDAACGDGIVSYQWFLNGDAQPDANGEEPELTWAQLTALGINQAGNYNVRLRVTDRFGVTSDNVVTLRVVNGPSAIATANPNRTGCGNQVTFSGEQSSSDGPANQGFAIVSYEWDLDGDGQYDDAQGPRVTRAAVGLPGPDGDVHIVAGLRVTDAGGRTSTTTVEVIIDVQNLPPVANAGGPYVTGPVGNSFAPVRLDGRGSIDPNAPCDQIVEYKWDTNNDGQYGADDNPDDLVGAVIAGYVNPNWQVNTSVTVRLIVCDAEGACSQPAETEITVLDEAPPSGVLIGPRADAGVCIGDDPFQVVVDVADPEGDIVRVDVVINGRTVGTQNVDTPNNGTATRATINLNPAQIAEGRHVVQIVMTDENGAEARTDSGGRITFDRTEPQVTIQNQLGEGVCYSPDLVPNPTITANDAFDAALEIAEQRLEDGCERTLRVTATDDCGNVGIAERTYRLAVPVQVTINGAAEGALVSQARMNWDVIGPEECANNIVGRISRDGAAALPYTENTLLNQPGAYALRVEVTNCQGVTRTQTRNFIVNSPPVAVPIPPAQVDPDNPDTYTVVEGSGLQLDGTASRPPEAGDQIARYQWDFDGDGTFDAEGATVAFPTDDDGEFDATLRVTDSLGAVDESEFLVIVTDVDPIANAGGPYVVPQGSPLTFDGRASRPGSAADPISRYEWDFGDGTPVQRGADLTQPQHTYDRNGAYVARLTVCDEDSCRTVEVRVEVRDVDPVIAGIDPPDPLYEIRPMTFSIRATAGSPADPITRYEWDIDGDGAPEYAGPALDTITHQFRDAGTYDVIVTVFDGDSQSEEVVTVEVAEITLSQLITWTGEKIGDSNPQDPLVRNELLRALNAVPDGEWGERYGYRGNSLIAVDKVVLGLVEAQANNMDFGLELWAFSRQMLRELTRHRDRLLEGDDPIYLESSIARASTYITQIEDAFGTLDEPSEDFEDRINNLQPFLVSDLIADAHDAFYWLSDAEDPCNAYGGFPVPQRATPQEISRAALAANADLTVALRALRDDLDDYVRAGEDINDTGPARDEIQNAIDALENILTLVGLSIENPCPAGDVCITDVEALRMEIDAMQLAKALDAAQSIGVWTRNWQNCLVLAIKFRIELSILRVESVCGRFDPTTRRARQIQQVGLNLVENGDNAGALEYYVNNDRQCFMISILNECLAPTTNGPSGVQNGDDDETPNVLYPAFCPESEEQPEGAVDFRAWIPPELPPE